MEKKSYLVEVIIANIVIVVLTWTLDKFDLLFFNKEQTEQVESSDISEGEEPEVYNTDK